MPRIHQPNSSAVVAMRAVGPLANACAGFRGLVAAAAVELAAFHAAAADAPVSTAAAMALPRTNRIEQGTIAAGRNYQPSLATNWTVTIKNTSTQTKDTGGSLAQGVSSDARPSELMPQPQARSLREEGADTSTTFSLSSELPNPPQPSPLVVTRGTNGTVVVSWLSDGDDMTHETWIQRTAQLGNGNFSVVTGGPYRAAAGTTISVSLPMMFPEGGSAGALGSVSEVIRSVRFRLGDPNACPAPMSAASEPSAAVKEAH